MIVGRLMSVVSAFSIWSLRGLLFCQKQPVRRALLSVRLSCSFHHPIP